MTFLGASGRLPGQSFFAPLADAYATKGTAALGKADTGQDWWLLAYPAAGSRMTVISGKLTNTVTAAGPQAGYMIANIGKNVASLSATFVFSAGTGGGEPALAIWKTIFHTVGQIPDSPCHFIATPFGWSFGVFQSGSLITLDSGTFVTPCPQNDTTVLTMGVSISGTTATVTLPAAEPRGSVIAITDARIASLAGPYASFESYQNEASTDCRPRFISVAAA